MRATYEAWIAAYLKRMGGPSGVYGRCKQAVEEMKAAFPDLEVVRGHAWAPAPWGRRQHWWLIDVDGKTVDPTAEQFGCILEYEPLEPGEPVAVGVCMDCGAELLVTDESEAADRLAEPFCDETCKQRTLEYLARV